MTDRRSPLDAYDASDTSTLPTTKEGPPLPPVPFMQGWRSSFWNSVDSQDAGSLEREAQDNVYADLVEQLRHGGIDSADYTTREARDGWALSYNHDAIWRGIAAARQRDPRAFAGLPGSAAELDAKLIAPVTARRALERDQSQRSGVVPWALGQFGAGLAEPENQILMLTGAGEAKTIAGAIAKDALLNAQVTAIEQPIVAAQRAKQGLDLTPGEAAQNVAEAGIIGGVFGGTVRGLGAVGKAALGRVRTPAGDMAAQMRGTLGENMTDPEAAATHVLERADEVAQASPFTPGAGTEAHGAMLDDASRRILYGPPAPASVPRETSGSVPRDAIVGPAAYPMVKRMIGRSEARPGHDYNAASGATGPYQFMEKTWVGLFRKRFPGDPRSDTEIAGLRRDPALNETLMDDLLAHNSAVLRRIGVPETAGNLYMMHFLGPGEGPKVLRAPADTPIADLVRPVVIEQNPFLRGKTAGEVVEWAHARMGDTGHPGPVLRRELFDDGATGDRDWAAAQARVDAEVAAARAATDRAVAPDAVPGADTVPAARPVEWAPADDPALARLTEAPPVAGAPAAGSAPDTAARVEIPSTTEFTTAKGSTYRVGADGTTTRDKAPRSDPGHEGQQGPQPKSEATHYVTREDALKLAEFQAQGGPKVAVQRLPDGRVGVRYLAGKDKGKFEARTVVTPQAGPAVGLIPVETWKGGARVHFGNEITAVRAGADIAERAPGHQFEMPLRDGRPTPTAMAHASDLALHDPDRALADKAATSFDDPYGPAANAQAEGLSHDIRQQLDSGKMGGTAFATEGVALGRGDAAPIYQSAEKILESLDLDDAAIAAVKGCL